MSIGTFLFTFKEVSFNDTKCPNPPCIFIGLVTYISVFPLKHIFKCVTHIKKIENKETFTVYFGSSYCTGCSLLKDTFKELNKKGKTFGTWYYGDVTNVDYENILKKNRFHIKQMQRILRRITQEIKLD